MDDYYIICGFGRGGKVVFNELNKKTEYNCNWKKKKFVIISKISSVVSIHKCKGRQFNIKINW